MRRQLGGRNRVYTMNQCHRIPAFNIYIRKRSHHIYSLLSNWIFLFSCSLSSMYESLDKPIQTRSQTFSVQYQSHIVFFQVPRSAFSSSSIADDVFLIEMRWIMREVFTSQRSKISYFDHKNSTWKNSAVCQDWCMCPDLERSKIKIQSSKIDSVP